MKQKHLRDQRGVAMVLELLLVVAVLTLAGLAVYQSSHRVKASTASTTGQTPSTSTGIAASAAALSVQAAATDAALSADADNTTATLNQTSTDASNLGASSNASF
jgi:Tfp pilus assembly protein PilX